MEKFKVLITIAMFDIPDQVEAMTISVSLESMRSIILGNEDFGHKKGENRYYTSSGFYDKLFHGDISCTHAMFVPDKYVLKPSVEYTLLRDRRREFISKQFIHATLAECKQLIEISQYKAPDDDKMAQKELKRCATCKYIAISMVEAAKDILSGKDIGSYKLLIAEMGSLKMMDDYISTQMDELRSNKIREFIDKQELFSILRKSYLS